jgi:hypothetical protein
MLRALRAGIRVLDWPWGIWGGLYICCIPLFAWIFAYKLPSHSFYHATLQHEPEIRERFTEALEHLSQDYSEARQYDDSCKEVSFSSSVESESLRIDGDDVSFTSRIVIGRSDSGGPNYRLLPRVHFSLARSFDLPHRLSPSKGRGTRFEELRIEGLSDYAYGSHLG